MLIIMQREIIDNGVMTIWLYEGVKIRTSYPLRILWLRSNKFVKRRERSLRGEIKVREEIEKDALAYSLEAEKRVPIILVPITCLCIYIYIYMHIYVYIYMHIYIYIYAYV